MTKSEMIYSIHQEMALERMGEDIAIIAKDVSDLQLDMLTVREEMAELKQLVKNWRKNKNDKHSEVNGKSVRT